jgi:putative transposase
VSKKYIVNNKKNKNNKEYKKFSKTNNILKIEKQIKKVYKKISNIRNNYIHQCTIKLIKFFPKRIIMEDLNVIGMMKNKHLSRAIQEQCFFEFERQIKYKSEWNGIKFILANRFFPSSKTCSNCKFVKKDLKLKDRIYTCKHCGFVIDRDINASINLMNYSNI